MIVTHESIRHWCRKFCADFARRLRRRRAKLGDTWHLDEVFIRINGVLHYLSRGHCKSGARRGHPVTLTVVSESSARCSKMMLQGETFGPTFSGQLRELRCADPKQKRFPNAKSLLRMRDGQAQLTNGSTYPTAAARRIDRVSQLFGDGHAIS